MPRHVVLVKVIQILQVLCKLCLLIIRITDTGDKGRDGLFVRVVLYLTGSGYPDIGVGCDYGEGGEGVLKKYSITGHFFITQIFWQQIEK